MSVSTIMSFDYFSLGIFFLAIVLLGVALLFLHSEKYLEQIGEVYWVLHRASALGAFLLMCDQLDNWALCLMSHEQLERWKFPVLFGDLVFRSICMLLCTSPLSF